MTIWAILAVWCAFNVVFVLGSTRYRKVRNRERGHASAPTRFI